MTFEANSKSAAASASAGARRVLALFIILFWLAQYGLATVQRMAFIDEDVIVMLLPRFLVTLCSIGLSFVIAAVLMRTRGASPRTRVTAMVALALAATPVHAALNFAIFRMFLPLASDLSEVITSYGMASLSWLWSYAAASGMIYALLSHFEAQQREQEISRLQRIAGEAQLRALRYQLNPHFMFNTLNSVTALISAGQAPDAEEMVENLADFLRAGLSLDPLDDITLAREMELQSLYLAIEKVRFGDRLRICEEVSPVAARALVPSLITQPLIENAIRHAVAATGEPVELAIAAHVEGDKLHVVIRNSAPDMPRPGRRGTGVGLINVEERLRARFGSEVQFSAGRGDDGIYAVRFTVPCILVREVR